MIDLRSDTVTKPTAAMRKVMAEAEVGDDVWGDDPTVNRLEELAAEMLDTEAALYVSSGTQSNLVGILCHCQRGEEYIVGQAAHTYKYEGGGAGIDGANDEYWALGLNVNYTINQFLSAEAGYNFDDYDSGVLTAVRSYDRNRVYIGLRSSY